MVPPASEGSFAPTGSLQTDCFRCPALLLGDGRVFVAGGVNQIFDPTTETFSIAGQIQITAAHGALLPDGQVMLAGGNGELAIVDPETGSARTLRTQNEPEQIPAALDYTVQIPVALEDGRVLVFSQAGVSEVDLATGALSQVRTMATPLTDTMIAMPLDDGNVLVTGRTLDDTGSAAAIFNSDTGVFLPVESPSSTMNTAAAIRLVDGRVLLTGGSSVSIGARSGREAQIFDPQVGTFSNTGSMSAPGGGQAEPVALLPDGRVLVVRSTNDITAVATTEIFDPETGTFTAGPPTTRPRFGATAVTLQDGRVLLLGSYRGNAEGIPGDGPSSAEIFSLAQPAE